MNPSQNARLKELTDLIEKERDHDKFTKLIGILELRRRIAWAFSLCMSPCLEGLGAGRPVQAPGSLHHTSKLVAYRKVGRLGKDVIWYKATMNVGNGWFGSWYHRPSQP